MGRQIRYNTTEYSSKTAKKASQVVSLKPDKGQAKAIGSCPVPGYVINKAERSLAPAILIIYDIIVLKNDC